MADSKIGLRHANIIEILGTESLPEDQRLEILNSAYEVVELESLNRVYELIGDEDKESFSVLLEEGNMEKIKAFLGEKEIDIMTIMEEEVEKVKETLIKESKV